MTNLRKFRLKRGLTLKQVSKRIGRTEGCISHYERERRKLPIETAKLLAREYGCEWTELYEDGDDGKADVG